MNITIITDSGDIYGSGHYQRMATLASAINLSGRNSAFICSRIIPDFIPLEIRIFYRNQIPQDTDLILRDMRDSSEDEIKNLQKTAPVAAIDDIGAGRKCADYRIDFLPNKINISDPDDYRPEFFLYGYSFTSTVNLLREGSVAKTIDALYYPGLDKNDKIIENVISLFPENSLVGILLNEKSFFYQNGSRFPMNESYAEVLLKSKIIITHFGITLYEAVAAGCVPVVINPTGYHSSLTGMLPAEMNVHDLGLYDQLDPAAGRIIIKKILDNAEININLDSIREKVNSGLNRFISYIESLNGISS